MTIPFSFGFFGQDNEDPLECASGGTEEESPFHRKLIKFTADGFIDLSACSDDLTVDILIGAGGQGTKNTNGAGEGQVKIYRDVLIKAGEVVEVHVGLGGVPISQGGSEKGENSVVYLDQLGNAFAPGAQQPWIFALGGENNGTPSAGGQGGSCSVSNADCSAAAGGGGGSNAGSGTDASCGSVGDPGDRTCFGIPGQGGPGSSYPEFNTTTGGGGDGSSTEGPSVGTAGAAPCGGAGGSETVGSQHSGQDGVVVFIAK